MTYKYYISEHHMGRQVDLLQASIQSQLEGVNKETLLNIWLINCLKNVLRIQNQLSKLFELEQLCPFQDVVENRSLRLAAPYLRIRSVLLLSNDFEIRPRASLGPAPLLRRRGSFPLSGVLRHIRLGRRRHRRRNAEKEDKPRG